VEWGIYGLGYHVAVIPTEKFTHVSYGFILICGPNDSLQKENPQGYSALVSQCAGKPDFALVVHDKFAALAKGYPGDKWDDPIRGNFGRLIRMKQQNLHIKVLPSIDGWTLSDSFFHFLNDPAKRAVFVNSVKEFLTTYVFSMASILSGNTLVAVVQIQT
jgi:chitinase